MLKPLKKLESTIYKRIDNTNKDTNTTVSKYELLNFVSSEVNLTTVPIDTWWMNMCATTHISVTMHGCLRSHLSNNNERYIYG